MLHIHSILYPIKDSSKSEQRLLLFLTKILKTPTGWKTMDIKSKHILSGVECWNIISF